MKGLKFIAAFMASIMTFCSCPIKRANAEETDAPLTSSEIFDILSASGADEDLISMAMTRSNSYINDFVVYYYSKSPAVNQTLYWGSSTFFNSNIIPYYFPLSSTGVMLGSNSVSSPIQPTYVTNTTGGKLVNYNVISTPTAANQLILAVLFTSASSSASTASLVPQLSAWNTYISADVVGVGDVNLDGWIDVSDAVGAASIADGLFVFTNERKQRAAADVDGDGSVTQNDVSDILKYIAEQISTFFPTSMDMGDKTNYWGDQE